MERSYGYTRVLASGAPAPGATVTVFNGGLGTLATIFSDNLGTPKANPFVADSNGYFFFYAAGGRYDIQFSGTGIAVPYTWGDEVLSDFVSLGGLTASAQLFAAGTAGADFNIVSAVATHTFNLPDAGAAARGVVNTGAQTFAGPKTFSTPIAAGSGGTGLNASAAANGQLIIGNGAGFSLGTIGGTANQVNVAVGAGTITLSTPQSIGTANSPTFAGLTLSGIADKALMYSAAGVLTSLGPLTDGQVVIGRTGLAPVAATLTAGTGITITNGAGSITIAASALGITSLNGSTASVQTFSTGTSGTDFNIVTNTGAGSHTFNIPDASASARGFINTSTQTIAGQKQFDLTPQWKPGTDSAYDAVASGLLSGSVDLTQHSNVSTGLTDMTAYTLPANVLGVNLRGIYCMAWGTTAANGNTKSLFFRFGGSNVNLASGGFNGETWIIEAWVWRVSNTVQKMIVRSTLRAGAGDIVDRFATPSETLSGTVVIKTQSQSGTASTDVTQEGFYVETIGA